MGEIILDELTWIKNTINNNTLGKKPSETIRMLAQYYFEEYGLNKSQVREKINEYIKRCCPYASLVKWEESVTRMIDYASKHKMINIDSVTITKNEIDSIRSIKSRQEQRLCFTLLCLSKYWNLVNSSNNNWVNTKDSDIMKMANINTSVKRQCCMMHSLADQGLIQFSKKIDNTNVQVCFADSDEEVMHITDFRNLGYQFMRYCGYGEFFECARCGSVEKYKQKSLTDSNRGRKKMYCARCSVL